MERDKKDLILATLSSRIFLERLLKYDWVLPGLFAQESYNKSTQELNYDKDLYNSTNKTWAIDKELNASLKLKVCIKANNLFRSIINCFIFTC